MALFHFLPPGQQLTDASRQSLLPPRLSSCIVPDSQFYNLPRVKLTCVTGIEVHLIRGGIIVSHLSVSHLRALRTKNPSQKLVGQLIDIGGHGGGTGVGSSRLYRYVTYDG